MSLIDKADELDETNPVNWRNHIILCGINELSIGIAEQLVKANIKVVVVDDDHDKRLERPFVKMGAALQVTDSLSPETLIAAGIFTAAALIANKESDLRNLETMLVANELVNGIRIVANFFNDDDSIRRQIEGVVPNARVLSLAEIAGPAFVEACIPSTILHFFQLDNSDIAVVEAKVSRRGTIGGLFSNVIPLAVYYRAELASSNSLPVADGANTPALASSSAIPKSEVYPPQDRQVEPGDIVALAGRIEELQTINGVYIDTEDLLDAQAALRLDNSAVNGSKRDFFHRIRAYKQRRKTNRVISPLKNTVATIFQDFEKPFRIAMMVVGSIIFISTFVLWFFFKNNLVDNEGKPHPFTLLDAFYFTVTIVTTTGFGDYNFASQEWPLKIYGIFLILVGAASVAVVYAFVTNYVITQRINQALGRQRTTTMENHVILCGIGSVGIKVLEGLLARGQQVVVIERSINGRFVAEARRLGVPLVFADARLQDSLREANIEKARCIAVMTSDDLANFETALNARKLHSDSPRKTNQKLQVVLRLFDRSLAERIKRSFDINNVLSASALAAPYFIGAALKYEVINTFYLQNQLLVVSQLVVGDGRLNNMSIQQLHDLTHVLILAHIPKTNRVAANVSGINSLWPKEYLSQPIKPDFQLDANLVLCEGDTVYFAGPYDQIIHINQLNR